MARKKTNPEEVNVTAAAEEPAPQDTPLTEAGMPPGDVPEATTRICLLYTSPSPRDTALSRMPSSA